MDYLLVLICFKLKFLGGHGGKLSMGWLLNDIKGILLILLGVMTQGEMVVCLGFVLSISTNTVRAER